MSRAWEFVKLPVTKTCRSCGFKTRGFVSAIREADGALVVDAWRLGLRDGSSPTYRHAAVAGMQALHNCNLCQAEARAQHYAREAQRFAQKAQQIRAKRANAALKKSKGPFDAAVKSTSATIRAALADWDKKED